jgi:hypothetical protein
MANAGGNCGIYNGIRDPSACQMKCQEVGCCQFWNHHSGDKRCVLKFDNGSYYDSAQVSRPRTALTMALTALAARTARTARTALTALTALTAQVTTGPKYCDRSAHPPSSCDLENGWTYAFGSCWKMQQGNKGSWDQAIETCNKGGGRLVYAVTVVAVLTVLPIG